MSSPPLLRIAVARLPALALAALGLVLCARAPASARAQEPAAPRPGAPAGPAALRSSRLALTLVTGERAYRAQCVGCHGRRGDGNGPSARFLEVVPRDFTRGVYKWRTTPSGSLPTNSDLARTVRRGVPGTEMPPFAGRMPDDEIPAVVEFIKTFSRRFLEEEPAPAVAMPRRVPRLDAAAEHRGRLMYALMQCWTCHGVRGDGRGPASDTLQDDQGRPIQAYDFTNGRFRSGGRPLDVYRTFTTGVDGTPMPAYEDVLLVGSDAFPDLAPLRPALGRAGLSQLRAFLRAMPTTEAIAELPDAERQRRAADLRWDLVAYVLSMSRGSRVARYLASPFYRTE